MLAASREILEEWVDYYERPTFIETDPISIAHRFSAPDDIEIAAFLTSLISWGRRDQILLKAGELMQRMDNTPAEFVRNHSVRERKSFSTFYYRTFQGNDGPDLLQALQAILKKYNSLENCFAHHWQKEDAMSSAIHAFRKNLFSCGVAQRAQKHLGDPLKNSTAKRFCMFLRWMVRSPERGVDFGIWKKIKPEALFLPLDIHSGRMARHCGLLKRNSNDWKAVEELTANCRLLNPSDPCRYDYALFGPAAITGIKVQELTWRSPY